MFREIFAFELRYQRRQPVFWVLAAVFFLLTFAATTIEGVSIGDATGGGVHLNSPYTVLVEIFFMSIIGVFIGTALVAPAVLRDRDFGMEGLVRATPVTKRDQLFGRFFGAYLMACLAFAPAALGIFAGSYMPWLDPHQVGPNSPWPYLYALLVIGLPNIFISAAIFFSLGTLSRSIMATYVGVVVFLVLYSVTSGLLQDPQYLTAASLSDPFGGAAALDVTRYWTVFEKNTQVPALGRLLLWNRVLWCGVACLLLAVTHRFYDYRAAAKPGRRAALPEPPAAAPATLALPEAQVHLGAASGLVQYLSCCRLELRAVVKSLPFWVLLVLGALNLLGAALDLGDIYGTPVLPVTRVIAQLIEGSFNFVVLAVVIYYSAELVWRERQTRMFEIVDATPAPAGVHLLAKLTALGVVILAMLSAAVLTGMGVQLAAGVHALQPLAYLRIVGAHFAYGMLLVAVLAVFLQVLSPNKYLGMLLAIAYFIVILVMASIGWEHHLYRYATWPSAPYSDMDGYAPTARAFRWFALYWGLCAALLAVSAHLLWRRGAIVAWRARLGAARREFRGPLGAMTALLVLAFAACGAYIYYNTNVLNRYQTEDDRRQLRADYEKTYGPNAALPLPRIVSVQADVDIYPAARAVRVSGRYVLKNKTAAVIDRVDVSLNVDMNVDRLALPRAQLVRSDKRLGYYVYRLAQPLAPGAVTTLDFTLSAENRGFRNDFEAGSVRGSRLVPNGTFLDNSDLLPGIGYQEAYRLTDPHQRRRFGLPPMERMHPIDDRAAWEENYATPHADGVSFDAVVSTSADQTALAPGDLVDSWIRDGRRYFHYRSAQPMADFFAFVSARYAEKSADWHGVKLAVYYDPQHPYNVDAMLLGMQKALDYYTADFGPYQNKSLSIVEFPDYAKFAQSFSGLVPFSEGIGFIADLHNPQHIDYPFYVTAHETAHQWWGHQVVGADVQGATMLSETLAQYSALMVMKHQYGADKMRRFLKYELDKYLQGRGTERIQEEPLELVENQPYIHYRKGSLAMYALQDYIGEDKVDQALRAFLDKYRYSGPPYPISRDLIAEFRKVAPAGDQGLITDLFEKITLYNLKAESAAAVRLPDGRYRVHLVVTAHKYYSDSGGKNTEVPMDDAVDIAVLGPAGSDGELGAPLYLEKRSLSGSRTDFDIVVSGKPAQAGIDPYNILVDRDPDDNLTAVKSGK